MFHGRPPSQDAEAEDSRQPALGIALLEFGRDVTGGVAIPPPELRLSIRGWLTTPLELTTRSSVRIHARYKSQKNNAAHNPSLEGQR